ncbi:hypothetical protein ACFWZG_003805 [Salmonella enterica]|uniref:hypothetical protein n=1 Tax=Salmonella enterica TaxID=28901 RepID=UPI003A90321B
MMIKTSNENKASQCTDMASIRTEIDRIDREVRILAQREHSFWRNMNAISGFA